MIKVGQTKKAKYWGEFKVKKVAELKQPVMCHSEEKGDVEFMPTIVQIEWKVSPSPDNNEYWFPYWQKIQGKIWPICPNDGSDCSASASKRGYTARLF